MKKLTYALLFFGILLVHSAQAQKSWWGKSINGEGPIVTKTLDLSSFTGIGLGIAANVILTQGSQQSVKVEGQANIIDNIKTRVSGENWHIGFEKNANNYKSVTIYITVPTLTEVSVSGSGRLESTNHFPNLDELDVNVSGSGRVQLDVGAAAISTNLSGSGKVKMAGSTDKHRITISGSGGVQSYDLTANDCKITISGSGKCKVHVKDQLKATVSGSGDVYYKGDPNVKSKISGSGDVTKQG